jgi:hypothetical protein
MDGIHGDARSWDLETIADPGQQSELFFLDKLKVLHGTSSTHLRIWPSGGAED